MFSVIIPLYNKEKSVCETINSVLAQTYPHFEIIIVNDGSTDNSLSVVENINDKRIKIFSIENKGVSYARNYGVEKAQFEKIAFLDADDLWETSFFEEMNQLINDFPDASLWSAYHRLKAHDKSFSYPTNKPEHFKEYFSDYFLCLSKTKNTIIWTGTVIINKNDFFTLGGFNEKLSMGEDVDLWFRFALNYKIVFYNKILATYKIDSENRSIDKIHPFKKHYLSLVSIYLDNNNTTYAFKKYLRYFIARNLAPYYFSELYKVEAIKIKRYLKIFELPLKWILLFYTPYSISKTLFWRKK